MDFSLIPMDLVLLEGDHAVVAVCIAPISHQEPRLATIKVFAVFNSQLRPVVDFGIMTTSRVPAVEVSNPEKWKKYIAQCLIKNCFVSNNCWIKGRMCEQRFSFSYYNDTASSVL